MHKLIPIFHQPDRQQSVRLTWNPVTDEASVIPGNDGRWLTEGTRPEASDEQHVPAVVTLFNVVARRLLASGIPIGPDVLLTVQGRRSGAPRTAPVAMFEHAGRRGLVSLFGESQWVRNLRAAGRGMIRLGSRTEEVMVVELAPDEAAGFMRDVVAPHAQRSRMVAAFMRIFRIDLTDPVGAARGRSIFELFATESSGRPAR
jgi:deazaflavin-dependent oxidoreductase (nitroreductase family)